jgi:hypothetical protein
VLQFPGDSLEDYDAMVALEDALIEALPDAAKVDGHDVGSGEVNIFIFTDEPRKTFQQARSVLEMHGRLSAMTAAYRPSNGEDYTVIWPEQSQQEFRIK